MMVPFQLSTLPSRRGKTAVERRAKSSAYPLQMPSSLASEYCHPAGGWPFLPLSWRRPGSLLCWRGSRYGCVARISTNRWRSGSRGLSPANGRCPASGSLRQGWTSISLTQRGRASATVQVVSDLQCPASEGVAYVLQGEWDLAGRRCAAGSGLCWRGGSPRNLRPLGSNGRLLLAEIALK